MLRELVQPKDVGNDKRDWAEHVDLTAVIAQPDLRSAAVVA